MSLPLARCAITPDAWTPHATAAASSGRARVTSPVQMLDPPVDVAGRKFTLGCVFRLLSLAPLRGGVELAPLVPELESLRSGRGWEMRLRRPLLTLPDADAEFLRVRLDELVVPPKNALPAYLEAVAAVTR